MKKFANWLDGFWLAVGADWEGIDGFGGWRECGWFAGLMRRGGVALEPLVEVM